MIWRKRLHRRFLQLEEKHELYALVTNLTTIIAGRTIHLEKRTLYIYEQGTCNRTPRGSVGDFTKAHPRPYRPKTPATYTAQRSLPPAEPSSSHHEPLPTTTSLPPNYYRAFEHKAPHPTPCRINKGTRTFSRNTKGTRIPILPTARAFYGGQKYINRRTRP